VAFIFEFDKPSNKNDMVEKLLSRSVDLLKDVKRAYCTAPLFNSTRSIAELDIQKLIAFIYKAQESFNFTQVLSQTEQHLKASVAARKKQKNFSIKEGQALEDLLRLASDVGARSIVKDNSAKEMQDYTASVTAFSDQVKKMHDAELLDGECSPGKIIVGSILAFLGVALMGASIAIAFFAPPVAIAGITISAEIIAVGVGLVGFGATVGFTLFAISGRQKSKSVADASEIFKDMAEIPATVTPPPSSLSSPR